MIKTLALAAAATTLLAAPAAHAEERMTGEERLAKLLDGREAGEPQRCIRTFRGGDLDVIEGTAIVYERGDTVWVNRTLDPDSLDDDDYMVIRKFYATQLCESDQITTASRVSNFYTGNIFLTEFVPYEKVG